MKRNSLKASVLALVFAISFVAAGSALAGMGMGHGNMGKGCPQGMGNADCPGYANLNLTEEQKTKLEAERTRFWNETSEIRTKITEKEAELAAELAKPEVDREKIQGVQSQISALEADFNKFKADHLINVKAISPELAEKCASKGGCGMMGRCNGMGSGMGKGQGMGNMMNCPAAAQKQGASQK